MQAQTIRRFLRPFRMILEFYIEVFRKPFCDKLVLQAKNAQHAETHSYIQQKKKKHCKGFMNSLY